jgi:hypothetical protein
VHEIATDLRLRATVCGLKRLAERTADEYRTLIAHGTPREAALAHFHCRMLRQRIAEEHNA